jgi:hypothetical protein
MDGLCRFAPLEIRNSKGGEWRLPRLTVVSVYPKQCAHFVRQTLRISDFEFRISLSASGDPAIHLYFQTPATTFLPLCKSCSRDF